MATIGALESACPCCSRRERVPGAQWPVAVAEAVPRTVRLGRQFRRGPGPPRSPYTSASQGTTAPIFNNSRQNPQLKILWLPSASPARPTRASGGPGRDTLAVRVVMRVPRALRGTHAARAHREEQRQHYFLTVLKQKRARAGAFRGAAATARRSTSSSSHRRSRFSCHRRSRCACRNPWPAWLQGSCRELPRAAVASCTCEAGGRLQTTQ